MKEVFPNLFVGSDTDCVIGQRNDFAVIHACKSPCHQRAVGYKGSLSQNHPHYLILERPSHLFLNLVDMPGRLSHVFTEPIVLAALDFTEKNLVDKKVLIHCNQGHSRSPALALLFLSKRAGVISNASYAEAKQDFSQKYEAFRPGRGVETYLTKHWTDLC